MAKFVHVIPPGDSGGQRHQEEFPDEMHEYEIYILVGMRARNYGTIKNGKEQVLYLDHPGTVVSFGTIDESNKFVSTKEISKADILEAMKEVQHGA